MKFKKLSKKRWNNAGNASWNLKYYAKNVETSGYRIIDGWNKNTWQKTLKQLDIDLLMVEIKNTWQKR